MDSLWNLFGPLMLLQYIYIYRYVAAGAAGYNNLVGPSAAVPEKRKKFLIHIVVISLSIQIFKLLFQIYERKKKSLINIHLFLLHDSYSIFRMISS